MPISCETYANFLSFLCSFMNSEAARPFILSCACKHINVFVSINAFERGDQKSFSFSFSHLLKNVRRDSNLCESKTLWVESYASYTWHRWCDVLYDSNSYNHQRKTSLFSMCLLQCVICSRMQSIAHALRKPFIVHATQSARASLKVILQNRIIILTP